MDLQAEQIEEVLNALAGKSDDEEAIEQADFLSSVLSVMVQRAFADDGGSPAPAPRGAGGGGLDLLSRAPFEHRAGPGRWPAAGGGGGGGRFRTGRDRS